MKMECPGKALEGVAATGAIQGEKRQKQAILGIK
jgi:hypothetical protein